MFVDVDTHYTPPEMFDIFPKEMKSLPSHLDMNGFKPGVTPITNIDAWTRKDPVPFFYDAHGHSWGVPPTNWDNDLRIKAMKEAGFDKCCLVYETNVSMCFTPKAEYIFAKSWNDVVAKTVAKNDSFVGVARVPHKDPDLAIEEVQRAVNDLGYNAIQVEGSWLSDSFEVRNIESPEWWPFFEEVERLGIPIFVHGAGTGRNGDEMDPRLPAQDRLGRLPNRVGALFGFLLNTQVAMVGTIFSGLLDQYPNLKFVFLETDVGWVPGYLTYLDGLYDQYRIFAETTNEYSNYRTSHFREPLSLRKKPSQYCKENFAYTLTYSDDMQINTMIPVLVNKLGMTGNILLESDWPHVEGSLDLVRRIMESEEIDEQAKLAICGGNAEKLLRLESSPPAYLEVYSKRSV
jgi:gamma-resorcylate decarboxylase